MTTVISTISIRQQDIILLEIEIDISIILFMSKCDFDPSENGSNASVSGKGNTISAGGIVGIVAGVVFAIILMLDLKGLDLHTGSFTLRQIKAATKNFDVANKVGEGGFGSVYKGLLLDGTVIAVKQLSSKSKQGNREFVNEIGMISALQHPNLVKLYGCCIEEDQLLLVYEYMENNSLARALFGKFQPHASLYCMLLRTDFTIGVPPASYPGWVAPIMLVFVVNANEALNNAVDEEKREKGVVWCKKKDGRE
ncbi:hypothetical protein TEA_001285 [Camellia sinensis var. sinensis]|uniref:Protein kinase domain-containing protein n=1 Tax=Camellia sinensis var. sinensis TaxID=542762 RepID=A0A4S4D7R4_CAMSN|nr:hypothetical protein TEA_001285 [Camellia sinensis var. sinensis]